MYSLASLAKFTDFNISPQIALRLLTRFLTARQRFSREGIACNRVINDLSDLVYCVTTVAESDLLSTPIFEDIKRLLIISYKYTNQ